MLHYKNLIQSCAFLALVACEGGQSSTSIPEGGDHSLPAMDGTIKCYRGDAEIKIRGSESGAEVYWRRAYDEASGKITEDAVTVNAGTVSRTWAEMMIPAEGGDWTVTGAYQGGTYSGTASGIGNPGAWLSWTVKTTMDAGTKIVSSHEFVGEDILTKSGVWTPDDVPLMAVTQLMHPITDEHCQRAFSQWPHI